MRRQKNCVKIVKIISSIFGVYFEVSEYEKKVTTKQILFIQLLFIIATIYCLPAMYEGTDHLNNVFS